jgi:hypothetical protein
LEATNAIVVDFCNFKKNWLFCELRAVMWWFSGINSFFWYEGLFHTSELLHEHGIEKNLVICLYYEVGGK